MSIYEVKEGLTKKNWKEYLEKRAKHIIVRRSVTCLFPINLQNLFKIPQILKRFHQSQDKLLKTGTLKNKGNVKEKTTSSNHFIAIVPTPTNKMNRKNW